MKTFLKDMLVQSALYIAVGAIASVIFVAVGLFL